MGSPISNTIAEIFLQHIENTHLIQLLDTKSIIFNARYVNDIIMIYDTQCINSNIFHEYINQIHPKLQLNLTHEKNNCINFLDLLIIGTPPQPGKRYILETHNHGHNYQLPIQPYHWTQNRSLPIPYQQNAITTANNRKTANGMEHNKNHGTKQ